MREFDRVLLRQEPDPHQVSRRLQRIGSAQAGQLRSKRQADTVAKCRCCSEHLGGRRGQVRQSHRDAPSDRLRTELQHPLGLCRAGRDPVTRDGVEESDEVQRVAVRSGMQSGG